MAKVALIGKLLLRGTLTQLDRITMSLAASKSYRAILDGLVWLIPCVLLSQIFTLADTVVSFLGVAQTHRAMLHDLTFTVDALMPKLGLIAVALMLSPHYRLPRAASAVACLAFSAILASEFGDGTRLKAFEYALAFVVPLVCIPFMSYLRDCKWTTLSKNDLVGSAVSDSLNLVLPVMICGCMVALFAKMFSVWSGMLPSLPDVVLDVDSPGALAALYALLNSLLWFFGIHGYQTLMPLLAQLNVTMASDGMQINQAFLGAFVFIGGSGATLSLIVALLIHEKRGPKRLLALSAIPMALFNINELVLFALPVILNPRLFLPFLLTPLVNLAMAIGLTELGMVSRVSADLPFNTPVILNALAVTRGDLAAPLLQVINIMIGVAIYAPFVNLRRSSSATLAPRHALLDSLKRNERPDFGESTGTQYDEEVERIRNARDSERLRHEFENLAGYKFILEYQPEATLRDGRIRTVEALVRLSNGVKVMYPNDFLHLFTGPDMAPELDLWVVREAVGQIEKWRSSEAETPRVAINLTRDTLCSSDAMRELIALSNRVRGGLIFEITEQSFAGDIDIVKESIKRIRESGAPVYIDDFGTGYSSLSYLHTLPVDGMKIDRSFLLAAQTPLGLKVLHAVIGMSRSLGTHLVIEGVESLDQLALLDVPVESDIQGWLISRAQSADSLQSFLAQWHSSGLFVFQHQARAHLSRYKGFGKGAKRGAVGSGSGLSRITDGNAESVDSAHASTSLS